MDKPTCDRYFWAMIIGFVAGGAFGWEGAIVGAILMFFVERNNDRQKSILKTTGQSNVS